MKVYVVARTSVASSALVVTSLWFDKKDADWHAEVMNKKDGAKRWEVVPWMVRESGNRD